MELSNLNSTEYAGISKVLDRCWEWVREGFEIADEFCEVLASEEGDDFANASAMETNPQKISAWGCVNKLQLSEF